MRKQWNVEEQVPKKFIDSFPEYSRFTLQLLWNRNLRTQKEIDGFFNPDYDTDLHDPLLYKDMDKAVDIIIEAFKNKEKISIFGDYDHDGVSGAAVLKLFFEEFAQIQKLVVFP